MQLLDERSALKRPRLARLLPLCKGAARSTLIKYPRQSAWLRSCLSFVALLLIAFVFPSTTLAAECTDTWTGAAEGAWSTAANWSTKHAPTESDRVCIGTGKTVNITEGTNKITSLSDEGTLRITGGLLEITGTSEVSMASKLILKNATLAGAAAINISKELAWEEHGILSGAGKTTLLSSATGSIKGAALSERTFVNEGTLTAPQPGGEFEMANGATLENLGKFRPNGQGETHGALIYAGSGALPVIINKGTIEKTTSNSPAYETKIGVNIKNYGRVELTASSGGNLTFLNEVVSSEGIWGKGIVLKSGTFSSSKDSITGTLTVAGATGTVEELTGSAGTLSISSGSVSVPAGKTDSIGKLKLEGGTLTGAGTFKALSELKWTSNGTMAGTGSTTIASGAVGEVTHGKITQRSLVNEGTFTAAHFGELEMAEGAVIENKGIFRPDAEQEEKGASIFVGEGAAPSIINMGTVEKNTSNSPNYATKISVPLVNYGTIGVTAGTGGTLSFLGGGTSSGGSWGKNIYLKSGTYSLAKDAVTGSLTVGSGGTATVEALIGSAGTLSISSGSVSVPSGSTDSIGTLKLLEGGTLTGAGTFKALSELKWTSNGTMAGTGTTAVQSEATGEINGAVISERTLVNEGTLTAPIAGGGLEMSEGAVLENKGKYQDNPEGVVPSIRKGPGSAPLFINRGTLNKSSAAYPNFASEISVKVENYGHVEQTAEFGGTLVFLGGGTSSGGTWSNARLGAGTWSLANDNVVGQLSVAGGTAVTAEGMSGAGTLSIGSGSVSIPSGKTDSIHKLSLEGGVLTGSGTFELPSEFKWGTNGTMSGSGSTIIKTGASGEVSSGAYVILSERHVINEGILTADHFSEIEMSQGARIENRGTFRANAEKETKGGSSIFPGSGAAPLFVNRGALEKTMAAAPNYRGKIGVPLENYGEIVAKAGSLSILNPVSINHTDKANHECQSGDPVNCATGDFSESQTDLEIQGRGPDLNLTRSYSAETAASASTPGAFGYGWSGSFSDHLAIEGGTVTAIFANGSTVPFAESGKGSFTAPVWSQDKLSGSPEVGFALTLPEQTEYQFAGSGRLESVSDRNGNETTLTYGEAGRLEAIGDSAGRQIELSYNGEGFVESAEDPMGNVVKYAYESKNLKSVTLPGEASPNWQFKYDTSHRLTSITDGRGGKTTNEYDSSNRVISQTDPAGRTLTFKYEAFHTTVTNKATGAVIDERFTSNNEPYSVTHGYGTASATTETFTYNEAGQVISATDGDGHTTTYGYDVAGNKISEKDAAGEAKWSYNGTHDIISMTTPRGETTTIERDANGNVESISRPGPEETTQTTTFKHNELGELESATDSLKRTWTYGYDIQGDRTSETNPLGDEQTLAYDKDSRLISIVEPRGNVEGAKPSEYEVSIERDVQGRPLRVTDPLGDGTEYAYDANGNLKSKTNASGNTVKYTYNADDEQIKIEKPNGAVLERGYDGAGEVTSETDANKRTTKYIRNILEEPVEVIDPLGRKTIEEFDAAGNLKAVIDPAERKTTYAYDAANRLTEAGYSEKATPNVTYKYDADGNLIGMADGTGESSFEYDQLDRRTRAENGHGDVVAYGYDLGEELTGITYPNGKGVSRAFDAAGRLESVTDWFGGTTGFSYDADSNLTAISFPKASGNIDTYLYDHADRMSEAKFATGAETLASIAYSREKLGQIEKEARSGLPGPAEPSFAYDKNGRLIEAGTATFEYDPADNLTKGIGSTNTYDAASQLQTGTGVSYSYNKLGERTAVAPEVGPSTTYSYDQAGNLASVERPEEGEVSGMAESFAYDGTGLIATKTVGETTHHFAWDTSPSLPLLLTDGENSFLYGPGGLPIEQISNEEVPTYLHSDQLGSSRLLTSNTGEEIATFSFKPYGGIEASTGSASTLLGFAGQYTDRETGLEYLRARFYDPSTAQFMTPDPLGMLTREPYAYAKDNPLKFRDPSGLGPCIFGFIACDEEDDPCDNIVATNIMLPACLIPEEDAHIVVNTSAGLGDELLSPLPGINPGPWGRELLGINNVDTCSLAYSAGRGIGMFISATRDVAGGADLIGRNIPRAYNEGRAASRGLGEKFVHIRP